MVSYGVVLGGGGAKGGYEIGVWKALRELDIPICAIAGTSVGALNGAVMVQGDYELAENMWTSMTMESIINMEKLISETDEYREKRNGMIRTVRNIIASRGLDVSPLKQMLQDIIDEKRVRESKIDFGIVTFSLTDFKPVKLFKENIPEGQLVDYLLASACFPAFRPQQIDNKRFIDGGVYDNIPVSLMRRKNINNLIVVDISGIGVKRKIDSRGLNITYIKNSEDLGGTLSFDGGRSKVNMEMGYYDALKVFDRLGGRKYYIMPNLEYEKYKEMYLQNIGVEDFRKLYDFLGIKWGGKMPSGDRLILYKIMKNIRMYANGKLSLETIIPAMAEITAEQMGIDRMEVYTLSQLIDRIESQYDIIKCDKSFNDYMDNIKNLIMNRSEAEFSRNIKNVLIEGKFLIYYMPNINDDDKKVKMFRKFIAIAFTKICIANMFVTLVLSKRRVRNIPDGSNKKDSTSSLTEES